MMTFSTDPFAKPGLIAVDVPGFDRFYVDSYHAAELQAMMMMGERSANDSALNRWLDELTIDEAQQHSD